MSLSILSRLHVDIVDIVVPVWIPTFCIRWFEVKGDWLLCWHLWNCWPLLFKLSLHNKKHLKEHALHYRQFWMKTCRLSLPKIIYFLFRKNIRYHYRKFKLKYRWGPTGNHCITCIRFVNWSMFTFCSLIPNQICSWNHGDNTHGNE